MCFILLNLSFTLILAGLCIVNYFFKIKEITTIYLKYIIIVGILGLFLDFFFNVSQYIPSDLSEEPSKTLIIFISQLILFISIGIFLLTLMQTPDDLINLKYPSFLQSRNGTIEIGKIMKLGKKKHKFLLPMDDLEKHMFVCGSTGTGKSNFVQQFLINFTKNYDIPFLLVEFKGEYIFLQKQIENMVILQPGENFSLNIFNPEGTSPEIHAERIFDILKSGQFLEESSEYSPQMQKVLVDILTEVCKDRQNRSWNGFYRKCNEYLKREHKKIPMLAQTLISIRNRIRRFSVGPMKAIFDTNTSINIKALFQLRVLIDLSSIIRLGGEKEDALFFLNMILKYLWDENLTKGGKNYDGIQHLTIIEDAQYFAPQDLTKQTKLTTYLEDIALLQRGTGECLISIATRPRVSEEILANCGILAIFKSYMQTDLQCELLNLAEEKRDYLSMVEKGTCIIRTNSIKRPFHLWTPHIQRKTLSNKEIEKKNMVALSPLRIT
jgi:hypothetical protein